MRNVTELANTFIYEDGSVVFVEAFELDRNDLNNATSCERRRDRIEKKYGTKDIFEMMKRNASRKDVFDYLNIRHDLMMYGWDTGDKPIRYADDDDGETVWDVFDTFTPKQRKVLDFMIDRTLNGSDDEDEDEDKDEIQDVVDTFTPKQYKVFKFLIDQAKNCLDDEDGKDKSK